VEESRENHRPTASQNLPVGGNMTLSQWYWWMIFLSFSFNSLCLNWFSRLHSWSGGNFFSNRTRTALGTSLSIRFVNFKRFSSKLTAILVSLWKRGEIIDINQRKWPPNTTATRFKKILDCTYIRIKNTTDVHFQIRVVFYDWWRAEPLKVYKSDTQTGTKGY
jgi:hypothetical protein